MAKKEDNKLAILVKESGLDKTKSQVILDNFIDYFQIASDWEKKARTIVVTSSEQKEDMRIAREGRLFLKGKRTALEAKRKELKEQALREGRAIDGITNVLKGLIVPIEEYLDRQEHYVEIKIKEQERLEAERKAIAAQKEEERLAKLAEKKKEEIRKEMEKLEKINAENQSKAEAKLQAERKKAEAERKKAEAEQRKKDEKAAAEKKKADAKAEAERKKAEAEQKKLQAEKEEAEAKQKELEAELKNMIECPHCHKKFKLNQK